MRKITFLGAGAAPGVPSLCMGYGACDPDNPLNNRTRTSTYIDYNGVKILIDTSPDLRLQLINNNIHSLDAVLFTHTHADHLNGIDDLREINRTTRKSLNFYATKRTISTIKKRFSYLIASPKKVKDIIRQPSLIANEIKPNNDFYVKDLKITPLKLLGHNIECTGYSFNDGELVYIADFKTLASSVYKMIKKRPELMVIPLTTPYGQPYHASLSEVLECISQINPKKVVINHMASECDYEAVQASTPDFVTPAYDNMSVEF